MNNVRIDIPIADISCDEFDVVPSLYESDKGYGLSFPINSEDIRKIREVQRWARRYRKKDNRFILQHIRVNWHLPESNLCCNDELYDVRYSYLDICDDSVRLMVQSKYDDNYVGAEIGERITEAAALLRQFTDESVEIRIIREWADLVPCLQKKGINEVQVCIHGDFVKQHPHFRRPTLSESVRFPEIGCHRYLPFEEATGLTGDDAPGYALEFLPDEHLSNGELVLRVSDMDEDGHVTCSNTVWSTKRVILLQWSYGAIELHIYTHESKGGSDGLDR